MSTLDFYNTNSARRYPFMGEQQLTMHRSDGATITLPDSAVVDCTVLVGPDAEFDPEIDRVSLYEIRRESDNFIFVLRLSGIRWHGQTLEFTRALADTEYLTSYSSAEAESTEESLSLTTVVECENNLLLEGWLTTGTMADLANVLSSGQWLRRGDGDIELEPARIQNLYQHVITSISLANRRRNRVPGDDCNSAPPAEDEYIVNARCLQGPLVLVEGYNCSITQDPRQNALIVGGSVGAGAGEPCEEVSLYEGEVPPDGSNLLTGGPSCNEVIKSLNGLPGPAISIVTGRGLTIAVAEGNPSKLVVTVDYHGLAVCQEG